MRIRLQGPGHAASLLAELNLCRQSRQYCDVLLQVGNRTFPAHRAVLACAGTYFRNLFARAQPSSSAAFSLEFISPANFERVLTFVYSGEILTDLIDVGVLYELAERLGVRELVKACHATFPDLQTSVSANCKDVSPGDLTLDSSLVPAAASTVASVSLSASSLCSSAASCSSLSSSAGPSAAPTPGEAASPLLQASRPASSCRDTPSGGLPRGLKSEDTQSQIGYGQSVTVHQHAAGKMPLTRSQSDGVLPSGPALQLKIEQELEEEGAGGRGENGSRDRHITPNFLPQSSNPCSIPDSSAQLEACHPTSPSGEPSNSLQEEGGAMEVQVEDRVMFGEVVVGEQEEKEALQGNGEMEGSEEEQWRQLAGEIIELSDDENFMEEVEEDEDEDDLVCLENGEEGSSNSQVTESTLSCKACSASIPADPASIRRHAETHLTELGLCRVCGASFSDRTAGVDHSLSHVGVLLFTCEMCHLQFCSLNKLLRHHRQTASCYTIPQGALTNSSQSLSAELQCAVCSKTLSKDFQAVRDHLLTHVCPQSLSCAVCHLPQPSLCSLLWHALTHLSLPVFTCPHCAVGFVERPLLDRHMTVHAEEAAAKERERSELRAYRRVQVGELDGGGAAGAEELHCFLCQQTFRSSSAFQYHLSLHSGDSLGGGGSVSGQGWKRKADLPLECPPSSSSPREVGGHARMNNLGLGVGMGFSVPDKFFQGSAHGLGPSGVLTNGSTGQMGGAGVKEKWYRCRFCGKRFAHSGEFTYHLRIHTGEKPYQCKVCLRFFRGRSTMICHLKTHAGALMYRCTVCGLFFSTLKLVSSHMELHKDQLPPDFNLEETFMYNDHSKEPLHTVDA